MPRVIGIDAGTVSVDLCGLDDGRVFLERSFPTRDAVTSPALLAGLLISALPIDLVVAPSGYGMPLTAARTLSDADLTLAFLAATGEPGGIGGLRALVRALARLPIEVVVIPGVIHLASVPSYRKINRVDMGTADKVCAAALALREHAVRLGQRPEETSFTLLELGGAFTAAIAVEDGRIVDGLGGTSGPLGARSAGALDGEVAFLAGHVSKQMLFGGGVESIGAPMGWQLYRESVLKALAALSISAPRAVDVILSGRHAGMVRSVITGRPVYELGNPASESKQGAHGAALIADGLAGGAAAPIVDALGIRHASGTALDYLHVISPEAARTRLGI
jgi:predicted butyrate kinase (DUF1464 family)